jgi:signal peptidase I
MQCFNCRFENMPGITVCGRCGTSLQVATAVIDVNPPRARPWKKRLRRLLPVNQAAIKVRDASSVATKRVKAAAQDVGMPVPPVRLLWRLLVPGLAHFHLGQRYRGWAFLGAYLAFLALTLLFWGTTPGSFFLGLAFSAHASSALDVLFQCPGHIRSRLIMAAVVMTVLGLAVYVPAARGLGQIVDTRAFTADIGPFAAGDMILFNRAAYSWSSPKPGNVVLFDLPMDVTISVHVDGHRTDRIQTHEAIDRILAGPGAEVVLNDGELLIDGNKAIYDSLSSLRVPNFTVTVPEGHYLILPTMLGSVQADQRLSSAAIWKFMSVVPRGRIVGKVHFRHQPLTRFWWIR